MNGCGNTFIVVDEITGDPVQNKRKFVQETSRLQEMDGFLFIQPSKGDWDIGMRYFDRDGTEENMCGNGIRCVARYAFDHGYVKRNHTIMTGDGPKDIYVVNGLIRVNMGPPREFRKIRDGYFVNTSLAHVVYFRDDLDIKEAFETGRRTRYDNGLMQEVGHPEGLHANFVELADPSTIRIMTYEVGVEDITQACGTGSVASAYVSSETMGSRFPMTVVNRGGEVHVDRRKNGVTSLYLTGPAEYC